MDNPASGHHWRLRWPGFLETAETPLRKLVQGLDDSQYWTADALLLGQQLQVTETVCWAVENSPYYATLSAPAHELAKLAGDPDAFWCAWRRLPILTKQALRAHGNEINARTHAPGHQPAGKNLTSGSTGTPVEVHTTRLTQLIWNSLTVREHLWQHRNFSKRLGAIRFLPKTGRDPRGYRAQSWGSPVAKLYPSGPASAIHIGLPIDTLADWLIEFDPHYLLTSPSIAAALMAILDARPPSLEEIRCMFEPVDPDLERRLADEWQVRCADTYSANEVGYIAFRCPEARNLHLQAEGLVVEILDESGAPCAVGESGRVVVTSLHNLATPLLRYDLGDYATVGPKCSCGRGSSVIERVLGRVRNLARSPEGKPFWPVSLHRIRHVKSIRQAQYVQTALDAIELRIVLNRPLQIDEHDEVVKNVQSALGYPYLVTVVPVAALERGPTGKFEEFLSLIDP